MKVLPYEFNSKKLPKDFPREFDAHIYFNEESFLIAKALREKAISHFNNEDVFVGDLICEPIGPHPSPMFELNFPKSLFSEVTLWLMYERQNLSVLIHELTGDDYFDHTQASLWLGKEVPLLYEKFKA